MAHEKNNAGADTDMNTPAETNDEHESIVRHELDAAVNSLQKRIDNLKGVNVTFPKKTNPFRNDPPKSR